MRRYVIGLFLWMTAGGVALASTYTVTTTADSGAGSLRWAIGSANKHKGPDEIRFGGGMTPKVIRPLTPLPPITDAYTTIVGDNDGIVKSGGTIRIPVVPRLPPFDPRQRHSLPELLLGEEEDGDGGEGRG